MEKERPRKPGEPHPESEIIRAKKERLFFLDKNGYEDIKRLERERELRQAVANTPELSQEDSDYVARIRAHTARIEMIVSPVEKADMMTMAKMQRMSLTAYVLALHRHTMAHFRRDSRNIEAVEAFDLASEVCFHNLTGERVLSQVHHSMLQGGRAGNGE